MFRNLKDFAMYTNRPLTKAGRYIEIRSNSILILMVKFLRGKLPSLKFRKINLMINAGFNNKIDISDDGVLYCYKEIDLNAFQMMDVESQKNYIMDVGLFTLGEIFKHSDINLSLLEGVKEYIRDNGFSNSYYGPLVTKDNRTYRTMVIQGFDQSEIFVVIKKGRIEMQRIEILSISETSPFAFNIYLTELKFKDQGIVLKTYRDEHIVQLSNFNLT